VLALYVKSKKYTRLEYCQFVIRSSALRFNVRAKNCWSHVNFLVLGILVESNLQVNHFITAVRVPVRAKRQI